jgi:NAD(P)-dependent dehydrogenase (short-subunit alcohol dehydrogenase family)
VARLRQAGPDVEEYETGACSGIGAATARLLSQEGAMVSVTGIPDGPVEETAVEIVSSGGSAIAIPTDVSRPEAIDAAVRKTVREWGRLDILIPNAGIQLHNEDLNLHQLEETVWDRTHDVNYKGVYLTTKYGLAQFMAQGEGGVIVIVASITGLNGSSRNPSYMSGKHGLIGLTRFIGVQYAKHNIRCNSVCPGALERTPDFEVHPDPQGRKSKLENAIPLGRLGTPEDIAPTIAFLASPDAAYITGANFVVDGGLTVT